MNLRDVITKIPTVAVDAICIAHRASESDAYKVVWVNDAFCAMFATDHDEALNLDPFSLLHWEYVADFKSAHAEMRRDGRNSFTQDTLCLRCDRSSFWGGVSFLTITDREGSGEFAVTFVRDIDDLKNREQSAELALIEHEHLLAKIEAVQARLMSAIKMTPDPFCIFDARDRLVIWNPAFAESVSSNPDALERGMKKRTILEMSLANGFIDEAVGREEAYLTSYLDAWHDGAMTGPVMRIQGRDYKVILSRSPNGDRVLLYVDISEQLRQQRALASYAEQLEKANREISEQALHDELTGLGNRRYLNMKLQDMIATRERTGLEIAALHIDLDRFKQINDTMGHTAGDHVLSRVADILRTRVRVQDVVARIGGDEFVVLTLCAADSNIPEVLADRLIEEICKPILYENRPCRLGASVGIARTPMIQAEELLTCSDIALYKAKTGGRATKAVFDHVDLDRLKVKKQLADDILRGLEEGEFLPLYQPQIDLQSGEIDAIEALACWQHPERGLLSAHEFAHVAHETQIDGRIDAAVFRRALADCQVAFADCDAFPKLSFDMCLARLLDASLLDDLLAVKHPQNITFELVETVFVEDDNTAVVERLNALRGLGISLEVDDFGSGRASIVGLRRIAPQRLKIDRRLVDPIPTSDSARRLAGSIIEIGRALDIGVTAVGVSSDAHAKVLTQLGCRRGQGSYYCPAATMPELITWAEEQGKSMVA